MGLDLALGVIILIAAFRGWFQGFVSQAVRLAIAGGLSLRVRSSARLRQAIRPALSHHRSNPTWSTGCSGGSPRSRPIWSWSASRCW